MIYNAGRSQVLGRKERKIKEIWLMMTILQSFQQVLKVLEMDLKLFIFFEKFGERL